MNRPLILVPALLLAITACEQPAEGPRVDDLSTETRTPLLDRSTLLEGAVDYDQADRGTLFDLAGAGNGYLMDFDGEAVTAHEDALDRTYNNYLAGVTAVVAADITTALVIGPPAIGVGFAASGTIEERAPNVWVATNEVDVAGERLSTELTVTWVGVGFISEMRYSSADATDRLWFNGFVSNQGAVGWWDLYDETGAVAGVVEWTTDGTVGQFGYASTKGETAGDYVLYGGNGWEGGIVAWDESDQTESFVYILGDQSGAVQLPNYNGGAPGCWDAEFLDVTCPE